MTDIKQISSAEKYLTIGGKVIALVLAVYGGYKFIYGLGHENAINENNLTKIETTIADLKTSVNNVNSTMLEYGKIQLELTTKVDGYSLKQDKLTSSVKSLALIVAHSPLEFAKIMGEVEFELVQSEVMKSVFPETKIRIIKSDSIRKK